MNMKKLLKSLGGVFILMSMVCFSSCKNGGDTANEVPSIQLKFSRLDQDLITIDTNHIAADLAKLKSKYPEFLDFYLDTLMGFNIQGMYNDSNPGITNGLRTFLTYPDFRGLFDTIAHHYPNTTLIDKALNKGFSNLKLYYPQAPTPHIIYLNSNLNNYAAFTYDTIAIGIGLDMYLGEYYPYYASVGIPHYMTQRLTEEDIPVNVFQSLYRAKHPFTMENRTLLDMMIQKGKEQYFLEKIIPFVSESKRLGFTQQQLAWCEASKAAIYNFFIDRQFLYSTNLQQVMRYIMDGPNAAGMPKESPGNVGSWLGYQIVKAYVAKHTDKSLQDIIALPDAQKILQESKYKPK